MSVVGRNNRELLNYQFTQHSPETVLGSHCNTAISWDDVQEPVQLQHED